MNGKETIKINEKILMLDLLRAEDALLLSCFSRDPTPEGVFRFQRHVKKSAGIQIQQHS